MADNLIFCIRFYIVIHKPMSEEKNLKCELAVRYWRWSTLKVSIYTNQAKTSTLLHCVKNLWSPSHQKSSEHCSFWEMLAGGHDATKSNDSYLSIIIKKSGKRGGRRQWKKSFALGISASSMMCAVFNSLKDLKKALGFDWAHTHTE